MSEEKNNFSVEEAENASAEKKTKKSKSDSKKDKKPNFFVRVWKKLCKLCRDVVGEMKKVVWTPAGELKKSSKLVLITVIAIGLGIAVVDTLFSVILNSIAGLIG